MKFSASIAMAPPEQYVPVAQEAEKLGYHAIVLPDSIFYSEQVSKPYPYTQDGSRMWGAETPWIEPLIGAAAMATLEPESTAVFAKRVSIVAAPTPAETSASAAIVVSTEYLICTLSMLSSLVEKNLAQLSSCPNI